jgi:hypothetical protein
MCHAPLSWRDRNKDRTNRYWTGKPLNHGCFSVSLRTSLFYMLFWYVVTSVPLLSTLIVCSKEIAHTVSSFYDPNL